MKLRTFQQPSVIESLLDSLVACQHWVPAGAVPVVDRSELMSTLQKLAIKAAKSAAGWRAWRHHDGMRFFVAEMSMDLSRERGCPALKLYHYNEQGKLQQYGEWIRRSDGAWQRCMM